MNDLCSCVNMLMTLLKHQKGTLDGLGPGISEKNEFINQSIGTGQAPIEGLVDSDVWMNGVETGESVEFIKLHFAKWGGLLCFFDQADLTRKKSFVDQVPAKMLHCFCSLTYTMLDVLELMDECRKLMMYLQISLFIMIKVQILER